LRSDNFVALLLHETPALPVNNLDFGNLKNIFPAVKIRMTSPSGLQSVSLPKYF
jgi:hypothetical protein